MRICGGFFGGRRLAVPKTGDIRPTQECVREALFSMLMNCIDDLKFLDLFAGSGAVGLEALSRGAAAVTFVEKNPIHAAAITKNAGVISKTGFTGATLTVCADAYRFVERFNGPAFDIVFADPPYALGEERGYEWLLSTLAGRGLVRPGGLFVAEMTVKQTPPEAGGWDLVRDRRYGKTRLAIWRRQGAEPEEALLT